MSLLSLDARSTLSQATGALRPARLNFPPRLKCFSPMPGGTYQVQLTNGQTLVASRIRSRVSRETLLQI